MKNVALYARVSSDKQEKEGTIESQISSIEDYAREHDLLITQRFIDDGVSGVYLDRPGLDQLRDAVLTKTFEGIVCYSPDRLARKYAYQALLLEEFEKRGISVEFVTERKVENDEDRLSLGFKGLFAEYERAKILERTRRGRLHKVKQGNVCTSKALYGFSYIPGNQDKSTPGRLVHNSEEIEVVKLILNWAKEGKTDRWIIKALHQKNIQPRSGSSTWQRSTISKILSTNLEVYSGKWSYLKFEQTIPSRKIVETKYLKSRKTSRRLRDKNEWITVPLPQLAIISEGDVELIRQKRQQNRTSSRSTKNFYLLQRMVVHSACNKPCYSDSFHSVAYYRCSDKKQKCALGEFCKGESIKAETLESAVWGNITNLLLNPTTMINEAQKYVEQHKDDGVIRSQELVEIETKRRDLEKQKVRVDDGYREGLFSLDEAKNQKTKIQELENELNLKEQEAIDKYYHLKHFSYNSLLDDVSALSRDLGEVLDKLSNEQKQQVLKWLSIKVSFSDYKYTIEGSLPVYNTSWIMPTTSWQHRQYPANESKNILIPFLVTGVLPKYINQHKVIYGS